MSNTPLLEFMDNIGLFLRRKHMQRILWMHELYQRIIEVHGVVIEFGTRWGFNLSILQKLRAIYEPYNHNRKMIGFDTFEGFINISSNDGESDAAVAGGYGVSEGYEDYLAAILDYHESDSPLSHIKKYELVKGDAAEQFEQYLRDNPETIIAFAYFDMDLYEPTKRCLELAKDRFTKGSIIGFDELNVHNWPGETIAVNEVLGIRDCRIRRSPLQTNASYVIVE